MLAEGLAFLGHDAAHLRDFAMQSATDMEVIEKAIREGRILITSDKDFGEILAMQGKAKPSVVVFRKAETNPTLQLSRLVQILSEIGPDLEHGAIVVIEKTRFRIRSLPILS